MILYRPIDGDVQTQPMHLRCKTCFLMTKMSEPIPEVVEKIRTEVRNILQEKHIDCIDANSVTTGRDYLGKIWEMIVSVPIGIGILQEDFPPETIANIFYEIGLLQAMGKETLVIKTKKFKIPSDFVRTEYIEYNALFEKRFINYIEGLLNERAAYLITLAQTVENNPLLAIDYYRRAYMLSGDDLWKKEAVSIFEEANFYGRGKTSVEILLSWFAINS
jgi:hypothetical protein